MKKPTIEEYCHFLASHDWFYSFSDDRLTWLNGELTEKALIKMAELCQDEGDNHYMGWLRSAMDARAAITAGGETDRSLSITTHKDQSITTCIWDYLERKDIDERLAMALEEEVNSILNQVNVTDANTGKLVGTLRSGGENSVHIASDSHSIFKNFTDEDRRVVKKERENILEMFKDVPKAILPHWRCECGNFIEPSGDSIDSDDERSHNYDVHQIECECGKQMKWDTIEELPIGHVVFDYAFQVYRDKDGEAVDHEDGDFSCSECHGPAKMTGIDSYYEYYKCIYCGHTTKVN